MLLPKPLSLATAGVALMALGACNPSAQLKSEFRSLDRAMTESIFFRIDATPHLLPLSGTGTYDGVMRVDVMDGDTEIDKVIGDVTLDAQFNLTGGTMSGSATDFYSFDSGREVAGTLDLNNGDLDRTRLILSPVHILPQSFAVNAEGTLEMETGTTEVAASVFGNVRGNDAQYLDGRIVGTATQGLIEYDAQGQLLAERQ